MIYHPQMLPEERAKVAELLLQDKFLEAVANEARRYWESLALCDEEHRQRLNEASRLYDRSRRDIWRNIYEQ